MTLYQLMTKLELFTDADTRAHEYEIRQLAQATSSMSGVSPYLDYNRGYVVDPHDYWRCYNESIC